MTEENASGWGVMRGCFLAVVLGVPLMGQPVVHWSFDGATPGERLEESYGTTAYDLSEVGGNTWNTRAGFGDVLANGGNAGYVSGAGGLQFGSGDFSVSLWVYRTSSTGSNASGMIDALDGVGTGFQMFFQADETIRCRIDDDAGNVVLVDTSGSQLALNTWKHVVVTVDRTADVARIFVDGVEATPAGGVSVAGLTGNVNPDQAVWISTLNGTSVARGRVDDVAIFDRVLTAGELASLNANGGTPVLEIWPAAELPGEVVFSPQGGILQNGEMVMLTAGAGETIRYTVDGTEPDETSTLYSGAFHPGSVTVRARAFSAEGTPGEVGEAAYLVLPAGKPNVLIVVADDMGYNDLGCYGAASVVTPRLDGLAGEGCRFTQFTTAGPGDLASQYALLTGRVARRPGLPDQLAAGAGGLDSREWTLAEVMRKAGYETGFVGEWNLGEGAVSEARAQGFGLFYGLPSNMANGSDLMENGTVVDSPANMATLLDQLTARARTFIMEEAGEPFFLVYQPPALAATGASLFGEAGNRIEALDVAVGELLDEIESQGVTNETLVVFLSDEGADRAAGGLNDGSNGQLRDGAGTTWEGGVRPPMMVRWPGVVPAGSISRNLLWLPDVYHALAEIVGGYVPGDRPVDGASESMMLLGQVLDRKGEKEVFLLRHFNGAYRLGTMRRGGWKLHSNYVNIDPQNTVSATPSLLYQVEVDPTERINRAGEESGLLAELEQAASAYGTDVAVGTPQLPPVREAFLGEVCSEVVPDGVGLKVRVTFSRPADSLNDHYEVQFSDDLTSWVTEASGAYVESVTLQSGGVEDVVLEVPLEHVGFTGDLLFLRLKATRP